MMKQPLFDFSQKYIEHGYLELCIPASDDGGVSGHDNTLVYVVDIMDTVLELEPGQVPCPDWFKVVMSDCRSTL